MNWNYGIQQAEHLNYFIILLKLKYSEAEPKVSASWKGDSKVTDIEVDYVVTDGVSEWQDRWQEEKRLKVKLQGMRQHID